MKTNVEKRQQLESLWETPKSGDEGLIPLACSHGYLLDPVGLTMVLCAYIDLECITL